MGELHVDLCMQNQDFHPEIEVTLLHKNKKKYIYIYDLRNKYNGTIKCKFNIIMAPQEVFLPETWTSGYLHP